MKHLYILTLAFFTLTLCPAFAQLEDSTVWYVADWKKGDSQKFRVTKKVLEYKNDKESKNTLQTYIANVHVTKVHKKYYELEWRYGETLFNNTPALSEEITKVSKKHNLQSITYRTDPYGTFIGIQNWKELRKMTQEIMAAVVKSKEAANKKELEQAMKPMLDAFSTKEGIEQIAFQEIVFFHFPYGGGFEQYDTLAYEDVFPNLFGGAPIKANGLIYYNHHDTLAHVTEMVNHIVLDPADSKEMVNDLFRRMTANLQSLSEEDRKKRLEELITALADFEIDIQDHNTFVYNSATFWPQRLTRKRETIANSEKEKIRKIEEVIIEAAH
ncbi:hypothetical protein FVR03_15225 [Pontibacter qinzhouensis]|uniref:Uncharacterized protein n=1 Tax=Pontibacter qinzhouensis TaxID=2603253 RepID=A0A5C8JGN7_9BACT|nr:hypothetical protein [Pontibacter qinzhouensis]TXK37480.1 hypothetical protein FVR03_15225 [Pontibacter qinzhouensis]